MEERRVLMKSQGEKFRVKATTDLRELLFMLKQNLWIISIIGILVSLAAFLYTGYFITPEYKSTTKLYILPKTTTTLSGEITNSDLTAASQLTQDYIELIKSQALLDRVISTLCLELTADELSNDITATTASDTRILTINVCHKNPETARDLANELKDQLSVELISVMNVESVNTVEEANLPTSPAAPNIFKNAVYGFLIGILSTSVVIIYKSLYNNSIKSPGDVEEKLDITLLAVLPRIESAREEDSTR